MAWMKPKAGAFMAVDDAKRLVYRGGGLGLWFVSKWEVMVPLIDRLIESK